MNIGIQNNLTAHCGNGGGFESLVVSDLEFLGLRQREGYAHRPRERKAREIEAEVVPEDLSGTLVRSDYPGAAVISESQARESRRKMEQAEARIEQLLKAKRNGGIDSQVPELRASCQMVLAPIVMPEGEPSQGWWSQLVQGDNSRQI